MYVQATKASLKDAPRMNAGNVAGLIRGDQLAIVESKGLWFRAKSREKEGWISRLFLSTHKPIGETLLMKDIPQSLEKASRRRSSSYAVSAAARGLMTTERGRHGRELYQSDYESLDKLEQVELTPDQLEGFRSSAKLSQ